MNRKLVLCGGALAAVAGLIGVACSSDDEPAPVGPVVLVEAGALPDIDGAGPDTAAPDAAALLGEPQVLGVMLAANTGEVTQGTVAQTSAVDPTVRTFADEMVTDHTAANTRANALAQQLALAPAASPVSMQLENESAATVAALQPLTGAAFDRAYIDAQVTGHTKVLSLIDTVLLPSATTPALAQELQAMRLSVSTHLTEATAIQAQLAADAGVPGDGGVTPVDGGDAAAGDASPGDASADDAGDAAAEDAGDAATDDAGYLP